MNVRKAVHHYFHTEGGVLGTRDYVGYSLAGMGQNMVYGLMNSYLMIFYTDVFLIPSTVVGTMFLIAKLWDAVNDPIMGTFIDKTRTKWGKMRPYFLFTPIPIAMVTILLFCAPNLSMTGKIVYMYITYIAWGMLYTVCDVPFWSMSAVLTPHPQERTNLVSFVRLLTGVGAGIPVVLVSAVMFLKDKGIAPGLLGGDKQVYFMTAVAMSLIGCALLSLGFFGTKERVPQNEKAPGFRESMGYLLKNKPLLMVLLSNLLAFPKAIQMGASVYVATYLMGGGQWVIILGIPAAVGGLLAFLFVPPLVKRFGAMKSYIYANIIGVFPMLLLFFIHPGNIAMVLAMLFLSGVTGGVIGILPTILIADCVDYMEWKTGQRSEGVSFSVQTFMAKASAALQGWATGLLLSLFQFSQPAQMGGQIVQQAQSVATQNGLWAMFSIIPAIGSVLCIIPLFFYDLKGETLAKVQRELAERRENRK